MTPGLMRYLGLPNRNCLGFSANLCCELFSGNFMIRKDSSEGWKFLTELTMDLLTKGGDMLLLNDKINALL